MPAALRAVPHASPIVGVHNLAHVYRQVWKNIWGSRFHGHSITTAPPLDAPVLAIHADPCCFTSVTLRAYAALRDAGNVLIYTLASCSDSGVEQLLISDGISRSQVLLEVTGRCER